MTEKDLITYNKAKKWVEEGNGSSELFVKMSKLFYDNSDAMTISEYAKVYAISIPAANKETKTRRITELAGVRIAWDEV